MSHYIHSQDDKASVSLGDCTVDTDLTYAADVLVGKCAPLMIAQGAVTSITIKNAEAVVIRKLFIFGIPFGKFL